MCVSYTAPQDARQENGKCQARGNNGHPIWVVTVIYPMKTNWSELGQYAPSLCTLFHHRGTCILNSCLKRKLVFPADLPLPKDWLTFLLVGGWVEGKVLKMDVSLPILQQRHLAVEGNDKREIYNDCYYVSSPDYFLSCPRIWTLPLRKRPLHIFTQTWSINMLGIQSDECDTGTRGWPEMGTATHALNAVRWLPYLYGR